MKHKLQAVTSGFVLLASIIACAMFVAGAVPVPQVGHVQEVASADQNDGATSFTNALLTASVNVKATPGNVYGVFAINGAATTCWVQLINSATAGTIGTGVIASFPLPASTTTPVYIPLTPPVGGFSAGIAVGDATTATGAVACGTGGAVTVLYK